MKISILTPSYNQKKFIEKNILSVLKQEYENFEHIIIDGGSTDGTIDILKKYKHLKWISEKDEGQADALNKGFSMSSGDIIGWINSDDYYCNNIFQDISRIFKNDGPMWVVGNLLIKNHDSNNYKMRNNKEITYETLLSNPDMVTQQSAFYNSKAIKIISGWDKSLHMTMDYDLWIKLSKLYNPLIINRSYAYFIRHPDQKTSSKNILIQIENINRIFKRENIGFIKRYWILKKKYYRLFKSILKNILIKMKFMKSE